MENQENFSDKYLKYNFVVRKLMDNFFQSISRIIFDLEIKSALEVGCGPGFSTQRLTKILKHKDFQASELRMDLVKEAQEINPGIKIECESIYELKKADNSFDLIIVLEVLEHLENPERALKELKRVTSRYCLLSVPNEPFWRFLNICRLAYLKDFGNTPGHIQHWSRNSFLKFLSKEFKVKKVSAPLPWTLVLVEK
ncbi:class I SAM-dependent methyltransferase [Candidatus Parcubacteria bacterium]|nr:class I SAM-dependent methyltransferase [Candidatus Parcubacteria bacterium]